MCESQIRTPAERGKTHDGIQTLILAILGEVGGPPPLQEVVDDGRGDDDGEGGVQLGPQLFGETGEATLPRREGPSDRGEAPCVPAVGALLGRSLRVGDRSQEIRAGGVCGVSEQATRDRPALEVGAEATVLENLSVLGGAEPSGDEIGEEEVVVADGLDVDGERASGVAKELRIGDGGRLDPDVGRVDGADDFGDSADGEVSRADAGRFRPDGEDEESRVHLGQDPRDARD